MYTEYLVTTCVICTYLICGTAQIHACFILFAVITCIHIIHSVTKYSFTKCKRLQKPESIAVTYLVIAFEPITINYIVCSSRVWTMDPKP